MSFRVLGTNHTSSKAPGHAIELIEYRAPASKAAVKVYVRDWDGVTLEFIEVATK